MQAATDLEGDLRDQLVQFPHFAEEDTRAEKRHITGPRSGSVVDGQAGAGIAVPDCRLRSSPLCHFIPPS